MNWFVKFFATTFFTGYIPFAPGTFGAAVGLVIYWFLSPLDHYVYVPTVIAFIAFAVWISDRACVIFEMKDPQKVTIDEVSGLLVTFMFHSFSLVSAIAGFVLFRLFDIWKPFPIKRVEKGLAGGMGVVMDDVIAGVYANIALWFVLYMIKIFGSGQA